MTRYHLLGTVGRFKPLHNGSARMLESLCASADSVIIGIGSSNRYNDRNPFTPEETREMIDAHLRNEYSNYRFVFIPDFGDLPGYAPGARWKDEIRKLYPHIDAFVTGNPYVASLLADVFTMLPSDALLCDGRYAGQSSTEVRARMACGESWEHLVPPSVSKYLRERGLDARVRAEFGDKILERARKRGGTPSTIDAEHECTTES